MPPPTLLSPNPAPMSPNLTAVTSPKTAYSVFSNAEPPPDLAALHDLHATMKNVLAALGTTFDHLGEQTAKVATLGPSLDNAHQLQQIRRQLQHQDRKHEDRIQELKVLLRDRLKEQIAEHFRSQVIDMIRQEVEAKVRQEVTEQLVKQIPDSLKQQVRDHKRQLDEVRRSLFNAEARRANALLRSNHLNEPLRPLLRPDADPSPLFPKDLATLFGLSSTSAKTLVMDYGLPFNESDSREKNLNKFMAHIGVAFQMVSAPSSSGGPSPPSTKV